MNYDSDSYGLPLRKRRADERHAETADERFVESGIREWFRTLEGDQKEGLASGKFVPDVVDVAAGRRSNNDNAKAWLDSLGEAKKGMLISLVLKLEQVAQLALYAAVENWNRWKPRE